MEPSPKLTADAQAYGRMNVVRLNSFLFDDVQ